MEVAVFINTFIRDDLLCRCVDSCLLHIPNCRLYITDNGEMTKEKKDFYEILEEAGHYVEIKEFNYPWRQAFNEKMDKLQGEKYVMKVDDDMYFKWEINLQSFLDKRKEIGLIGGQVWHCHRDIASPYVFNIIKNGEKDYTFKQAEQKENGFIYCDIVPDFWLARKEIFDDVKMRGDVLIGQGGHEVFFMDCYLAKKDWEIAYTNETVALHEKSGNTLKYNQHRKAHKTVYRDLFGKIKMEL